MSVQPTIPSSPGSLEGITQALADLNRRLSSVETKAGYIGAGAIEGSASGFSGHIAATSITSAEIHGGSITATHLAANAIEAGHINVAQFVSVGGVSGTIISNNTITTDHIQANSITSNHIVANTITGGDIQAATITADLFAAGTAFNDALLARIINATNITTSGLSAVSANMGTLTAGTIRIGSATGAKIALGESISTSTGTKSGIIGTDSSNAITFWMDSATGNLELKGAIKTGSTGLGNLDGTLPTTGTPLFTSNPAGGYMLVADSITAREIAASTITATEIAANTITAGQIAANTITGGQIAANTITADKVGFTTAGRNVLPDSSFELGTVGSGPTDWGTTGASATVRQGSTYNGIVVGGFEPGNGKYLEAKYVSGTDPYAYRYISGDLLRPLLGRTVVFSAYIYRPANAPSPATGARSLLIYDGFTAVETKQVNVPAGTWTRQSIKFTVSPSCTNLDLRVYAPYSDTTNGVNLYDAIQLEVGELATPWAAYIDPTVIDGSTITGATIRTAATGSRTQMTTAGGLEVYNGSTRTLQIKAGAGGLDFAKPAGSYSTDRRIRWLDGSTETNSIAAGSTVVGSRTDQNVILQSFAPTSDNGAAVRLLAQHNAVSRSMMIGVTTGSSTDATNVAGAWIDYSAGGFGGTKWLLRGDGTSDYAWRDGNGGHSTFSVGPTNSGGVLNISDAYIQKQPGQNFVTNSGLNINGVSIGKSLHASTLGVHHNTQTANYTQAHIEMRSDSGNTNPRITFHIPSASAPMIINGGGNFFMKNSEDTAYVNLYAIIQNQSGERYKENFKPLNATNLMNQLRKLPVTEYTLKPQIKMKGEAGRPDKMTNSRKGIGPTAEDFHAAFPGLRDPDDPGSTEAIPLGDALGICMALIKELDSRLSALGG